MGKSKYIRMIMIVCSLTLFIIFLNACNSNKPEENAADNNEINIDNTDADVKENQNKVHDGENKTVNESDNEVEDNIENSSRITVGEIAGSKIILITGKEAIDILSAEDDYIIKMSKFDYAAKFKSETTLDLEERKKAYSEAVLEWDNKAEIEQMKKVIKNINELFSDKEINLPDEVLIIKTNGKIESGAAYTRANAIIFPDKRLRGLNDGDYFNKLFVHELFHVYSRHNKDKRPEMYEIIGYQPCEELIIPEELKDLTIANPDAPDNNYYITSKLNGESLEFIPIIYSEEMYDINSNEIFFRYLNDDMLAVDVKVNKPIPVYKDGKPFIVKKDELEDFYDIIGHNTSYSYHPEETLADNFAYLILKREVPDEWVLEELSKIVFE